MSSKSTPRVRRSETSNVTHSASDKPLLIPRVQAKHKLACSTDTLVRLERDGVLTPVKLRRRGFTYYRLAEIEALVSRGVA